LKRLSLVLAAVFLLTLPPARAQGWALGMLMETSMALSLMPQQARGFSVRAPHVASQPLIPLWSIADPLVEHSGSQFPGECLLKPRKLTRQPVEQCRHALDSLLQLDEPQRASDPLVASGDLRDMAQALEFASRGLSKLMRPGPSKVEETASAFRIALEAAQFEKAVRIASEGLQVAVDTAAGPTDPEIAVALTMLGDACAAAGEMEPAGRMFAQGADIARAGRRPDVLAGL
jgi:hypothetical protein